jgi:hypothetical protein
MPARATLEQRIAWHLDHQQSCACRPIPAGLQAELSRRAVAADRAAYEGLDRLSRPLNPLPSAMEEALAAAGLTAAYLARPPYQRNDWAGWIARAKRPETRDRRLAQMLDELRRGDGYMNMPYGPHRRPRRSPGPKGEGRQA